MERTIPTPPRINALQRLWLREMGIEKTWGETTVAPTPVRDAGASAPIGRPSGPEPVLAPTPPSEGVRAPGGKAMPAASMPGPASAVTVQGRGEGASAEALRNASWDELRPQVMTCTACELCQNRRQAVFGMGALDAPWLVVGEGPGEQEDRQGLPFVGRSGQLLDAMLASVGLSRERNVYITNVIKCRPPGNRNPKPEEIAACSPYLRRQIDLLKPKRILVVGRFAAQTLLGTDATISNLRGRVHTFKSEEGRAIPLVVSYHPAYLLRSPLEKARAWQDLRLAAGLE